MTRSFAELIAVTGAVISEFDSAERRPWTIETSVIELTKQVGDRARRIMVAEGYYLADRDGQPEYETSVSNIADELADILYCVIRVESSGSAAVQEQLRREHRLAAQGRAGSEDRTTAPGLSG